MQGYKGFDKNLRCQDFQYKVGETYKMDEELEICERGFHFCDIPTAVFEYYAPSNSRFALVEAIGEIKKGNSNKFCTNEIKILKELTLAEFVSAFDTKIKQCSHNTGYCSAATNTGYCSAATNTGDCSAATNTGYCSAASVSGKNSVALVTGKDSKAKGELGCWLVLGEWHNDTLEDVQVFKVDGQNIKADTFYTLKDGRPIEVEEES